MAYNIAFFGLYQNFFLVLKAEFGEPRALELFRQVMEKGLKVAYDNMGFKIWVSKKAFQKNLCEW